MKAVTLGSSYTVTDVVIWGILLLDVPKKGSEDKKFCVLAATTPDTILVGVPGEKKPGIKYVTVVVRRGTMPSNAQKTWHHKHQSVKI